MCGWGGGPNELSNYVSMKEERYPSREKLEDRGFSVDSEMYEYIGRAEASLIDGGTMMWMCKRDGIVVAHQGMHERTFHSGD